MIVPSGCQANPSIMKLPKALHVILQAAIDDHCLGPLIFLGFFFPVSPKANKPLEIPFQFPLANTGSSFYSKFGRGRGGGGEDMRILIYG